MYEWQPDLPKPASENWREAYGSTTDGRSYTPSDSQAKTTYQAPAGNPVQFVYESMKLSGGLSVDTAEYPFFGFWSSTALNEKPQGITVSGFVRGDEYIKTRNALVESLRVTTTDDEPGYITLPLWGRFPVIVIDWDIEETAKELGQCKVNITFTRAGCPPAERWQDDNAIGKSVLEAAEDVKIAAIAAYVKKLSGFIDEKNLVKSFSLIKIELISVVGRVQAAQKTLNDITNEVSKITSLVAQGIRSPKVLALALFSSVGKLVTSLAEIKNAGEEAAASFGSKSGGTVAAFRIKNNEKNALFCFLPEHKYQLPVEAVTAKQIATKKETENLYKTAALYAAARILPTVPAQSYNKTANLFALYDRLERSVDLEDTEIYGAVTELRRALSKELAAKELSAELSITLNAGMPLLTLARYLGADESVLRKLNFIEDSFAIEGALHYV